MSEKLQAILVELRGRFEALYGERLVRSRPDPYPTL